MAKQKVSVSWSGGKDAALALYRILHSDEFEVVSLHTTFNAESKRVGMHGIPEALIEKQAEVLGLPLEKIYLPKDNSHGRYEKIMKVFCEQQQEKGVAAIVYGDILLADLKAYREKQLETVGLKAIFPLWGADTAQMANEFIGLNFKTLICCLHVQKLPKSALGKTLDKALINRIAQTADPCGENGEFHTFTFDGPLFRTPVAFEMGEAVLKSYQFNVERAGKIVEEKVEYWFQEVLPPESK